MNNKPPATFGEIPKQRVPFGDRLSGMCAMELAASHGDPEIAGEMIERLLNSLAFTMAITCKGDAKAVNEMLEGATAYLYDAAAGHARIAKVLTQEKRHEP